ncbi:ABC transporter permease [Nanoarchaeota archaeon]
MLADYIRIVFNALRRRKTRSWLTMIGIFIGIAAVVSLIGLGEGLRTAITSQFGFLGSDLVSIQASGLQYGPPGTGAATPLSDDIVDEVSKVTGVEIAINRYIESGTMEFNNRQAIGMAMSTPEGEKRKIFEEMFNLKTESGRLLKDGDGKKVMLGNNFKEDDIFGKGINSGDRVLINNIQFEVVGILEKKGSFLFDSTVIINEQVLVDDIKNPDTKGTVNVIGVKVKNEEEMPRIIKDIEKIMRKERGVKEGEEDFSVESAQNTIETLNSTLFAVQLFVYIIAGISLLVGGIGIMNTMYTAVVERTKEIGIMKSIGARNKDIFMLFFIESGLLGITGGIIGITIGVSLALGLAFLGSRALGSELIQAQINTSLIIGALLFSFIVGSIAGITPALRASKLHPVDALRFAK